MGRITGINANTPKHLLLDAGAIIKNYALTSDVVTNMANVIGATEGGATFAAVPTIHNVALDGAPTHTKGLERIDEWVVTLSATVKEHTVENIKLALGAATSESATNPTGYSKITGKEDFEAADYLDNVAFVGRISGSDKPVIILLKNALSLNGFNLSVSDKNEGGVALVITAHYDPADLNDVPFEIYYPNIT